MITGRLVLICLLASSMFLGACASLQGRDPMQVTVAGIEPLQGQGLELRMMMKLRVQNPNDTPVDYNGVALQMNVQGKSFASGVSDASGSVPRFGESVISVPVTISAFGLVRQAFGMIYGDGSNKIRYEIEGKLNGPAFGAMRFTTKGEFDLPTPAGAADSTRN